MVTAKEVLEQMPLFKGKIVTETETQLSIRAGKKLSGIQLVRNDRESGTQQIGYSAAPIIQCIATRLAWRGSA
jgi:hypothetical protein